MPVKELSEKDLLESLLAIGIKEGDTLFIHTDTSIFGKLALPEQEGLLSSFVETFKKAVGENGTIIIPTFSFSWGKGETFDVRESRSTVGSFSEFFRLQPEVKRSLQPMHSVAVWGAKSDEALRVGKDTFGKGSIFENLRKLDAKIVMFGVDFEYCTFLVHVEQVHKVPYRFLKTFTGTITNDDQTYKDWCTYFARPLEAEVDNKMENIVPPLREKHLLKEDTFGDEKIMVVGANDLFEAGMRLLDQDPYFLLTKASASRLRAQDASRTPYS